MIRFPANPTTVHLHPPVGDVFLLIQHDAEQPDKHPPGFACSGSDAIYLVGPAIQC